MSDQRNDQKKNGSSQYGEHAPEVLHCRRCRTELVKGVCPNCGYKVYVPMEKGKRDKIKFWTTLVAAIAFVVIFVVLQIVK